MKLTKSEFISKIQLSELSPKQIKCPDCKFGKNMSYGKCYKHHKKAN